MNTDTIKIHSDLKGKDEALKTAESFAEHNGLTGKDALHIRLLTEETVCMVHGILDNFVADFSIESEKTGNGLMCRIRLRAEKPVNIIQEDLILSVATSGKNESAKGIVGKIRELFRTSVQDTIGDNRPAGLGAINSWYDIGAKSPSDADEAEEESSMWSLMSYRNYLDLHKDTAFDEWDEIEKSIIAKLADDVKVWLKTDSTEVVIEKLIKNK